MIHPVYVDGPLKGRDFPVSDTTTCVQTVDPDLAGPRHYWIDNIVTYRLYRFGFSSGGTMVMFWLGSCDGEPSAEVLADMLLNDAAKAACDPPRQSRTYFRVRRHST